MTLTTSQYQALQEQYERTPSPTETFSASGEHYFLTRILNDLGFFPVNSFDAICMAEYLLLIKPQD